MKKEISEKNFELLLWGLSGAMFLFAGVIPFAILMWLIGFARKEEK